MEKKKLPRSLPERRFKTIHVNTEPTWRGGEQQALYLIKGLAGQGHIAHLICQPGSAFYHQATQEHITTFPIRMRGEFDVIAAIKIAKRIRKGGYDLIHSHTSHAHSQVFGASLFIRNSPIKIVTRRVDFSIFRHNFFGLNLLKYKQGVDHIIAISHKVRDILTKDGVPSDDISVAHSGVDLGRFQDLNGDYLRREFSISPGSPILGNVAFLVGHKGQEYLIKAISYITSKYPDVHLFIVGTGHLEKKLKSLVQTLELSRNITFTGFRKDVGAFLHLFDILLVSSVEEGLNTTILDALALEVPVVATNTGGIPEVIRNGETGILVPPADPKALASGIIRMLSNPAQAKEMARRGRRKVMEQFSSKAMVEKNIAVYKKMIAQREDNDASRS